MEEHESNPESPNILPTPMKLYRRRRVSLGVVVALAAAALVAWAVVDRYGGNESSRASASPTSVSPTTVPVTAATKVAPIGPIGMSAKGLRKLAGAVGQPIYWAGPEAALYELTRTIRGTVYVRYLPPDVKVGSKKSIYLIIATYPFPNALQALNKANGRKLAIPGGGVAVVDKDHPESVHLAYPGADVQVEVFDPSPARALRVAKSGTVRPVQ
jgi:hypothetical protein